MFEKLRGLLHHDVDRLEGIVGEAPVAVSLRASVAGDNAVVSPLTGQRAAFFHWDFAVERETSVVGRSHLVDTIYYALGSAWQGGDLVLGGPDGRLILRAGTFTVRFLHAGRPADPLRGPLPASLAYIAASPVAATGQVLFNELALLHGEALRVRAVFERVASVATPRTDGSVQFRVRPDLAPVVVEQDLRDAPT